MRVLEEMPRLKARGLERKSKVRRFIPREMSESWSYREVSAGTVSIILSEFTRVTMLARVNLGFIKVIGVGLTKGIPFAI